MKTDTKERILAYIKEKNRARPKEIVAFLGISAQAVFRQLKKLQEKGEIIKTGSAPAVVYSLAFSSKNTSDTLNSVNSVIINAKAWVANAKEPVLAKAEHCQTRDVFEARKDRLLRDLQKSGCEDNRAYLIVAVVGEIGNNSFDHNLGNWRDVPGIYFVYDLASRIIVLADRGQGVFSTIKIVKPSIKNDEDALTTAFTEVISGRAPEQRGNGLKYVKKIIQENKLALDFYSGLARCQIQGSPDIFAVTPTTPRIGGTISIIRF